MSGAPNKPDSQERIVESVNAVLVRARRSEGIGLICSAAGCLGWAAIAPFLDGCQQGEQLARFFAALVNVFILCIAGGLSTILLISGLMLQYRRTSSATPQFRIAGTVLSITGIVIATIVLILYLPKAISILN